MTLPAQIVAQIVAQTAAQTAAAPAGDAAAHLDVAEFSMLGGSRIMSSAVDAERSARLISWLCALVAGRDPKSL
jgi:hypothetical protein